MNSSACFASLGSHLNRNMLAFNSKHSYIPTKVHYDEQKNTKGNPSSSGFTIPHLQPKIYCTLRFQGGLR